MKTIEFEGKKYEVEDWVNWVARDHDGDISGFELKPKKVLGVWYDIDGSKYQSLGQNGWQDSLTKV